MTRPFLPELVDFQKNWGCSPHSPPPPARAPMTTTTTKATTTTTKQQQKQKTTTIIKTTAKIKTKTTTATTTATVLWINVYCVAYPTQIPFILRLRASPASTRVCCTVCTATAPSLSRQARYKATNLLSKTAPWLRPRRTISE